MNTEDLQAELLRFESILKLNAPSAGGVAGALREIYATKSAYAILSNVRILYPEEVDTARKLVRGDNFSLRPPLPSLDSFQRAAPRLLQAIALQDRDVAVRALAEMGILTLCPFHELLFGRLEHSVGCVVGPARLVPLIELAVVAAALGSYERASIYTADARTLGPGAPELHDIHTVVGLIALNARNVAEAKESLSESVRVCEQNEFACLACGIRAMNLSLAAKLLEQNECAIVVEYFSRCQGVWEYEAKRIAAWIETIRSGQRPDFLAPGLRNAMEAPVVKIRALTIRSSFLPATHEVASEKPNRDARARLDDIRADYRRRMAAAIKGKLGTGEN